MVYNYKFANKETAEELFGEMTEANQGYGMFTLSNGDVVRVENAEMDGSNLTNETYTVTKLEEAVEK